MPRRRVLAVLACLVAGVGLGQTSAVADTVDVGATPALASLAINCAPGTTYFSTASGPGYTTPAGVVTSWSYMARTGSTGVVALRTAEEGPAGT